MTIANPKNSYKGDALGAPTISSNGTYNFYPNEKASLTYLKVVSSTLNESSPSVNEMKEEKRRINFRDFFTYAIKGSQSDPI